LNDKTSSTTVAPGCEATILLSRHCEKEGPSVIQDKKDQHCSYIGHERAHFLTTKFGSEPGKWPVPSYLYALAPGRGHHQNFREIETLIPLANQHGLDINSDYNTAADLVNDIHGHLASGDLCGRTVLVSWNHEAIAGIASALGCSSCPDAFPDEFDPVWQLKFVFDILQTGIHSEKYRPVKTKTEPPPAATTAEDESNPPARRQLGKHLNHLHTKKHHHNKKSKAITADYDEYSIDNPSWTVFSTITAQQFDPLAYSASVGDYTSAVGGRWMAKQSQGEL
jgi:hypothetical protein